MEGGSAIKKIIYILIVVAIPIFVMAQSTRRDTPIVSDKVVAVSDTTRIVGKDEYQRILNKQTDRMQRSENKIRFLENKIKRLEDRLARLEGG